MRIFIITLAQLLILSCGLMAQQSTPPPVAPPQPELGKWWKNSEIVKELRLSGAQVGQIEQNFLNHRLELADLDAELKRREIQLNALMQADSIDETKVLAQTDLVATARAALERANSAMMLSIRKVLSRDQWKRLEEIQVSRRSPNSSAQAAVGPSKSAGTRKQSEPRGKGIYSVADGITPPKVIHQPLPPYTQEARDARIEGIVLLQVIIRSNGTVDSLKVLRGLGYGLDQSAINTIAKEWRFVPGTLNGRPVDVQANIEVSFRLY